MKKTERKTVAVVMNEEHELLPQQIELLRQEFGEETTYWNRRIPKEGMSLQKQRLLALHLVVADRVDVVFVSPVPIILAEVVRLREQFGVGGRVFILVNPRREKVEVEGLIQYRVPKEGWELYEVKRGDKIVDL